MKTNKYEKCVCQRNDIASGRGLRILRTTREEKKVKTKKQKKTGHIQLQKLIRMNKMSCVYSR